MDRPWPAITHLQALLPTFAKQLFSWWLVLAAHHRVGSNIVPHAAQADMHMADAACLAGHAGTCPGTGTPLTQTEKCKVLERHLCERDSSKPCSFGVDYLVFQRHSVHGVQERTKTGIGKLRPENMWLTSTLYGDGPCARTIACEYQPGCSHRCCTHLSLYWVEAEA